MELLGVILIGACVCLVLYFQKHCVFVVQQHQAVIIERLGRFHRVCYPGLHVIWPWCERQRVISENGKLRSFLDLQEQQIDVTVPGCLTYDKQHITIQGTLSYFINDPVKVAYGVANLQSALEKTVQTIVREYVRQHDADFLREDSYNMSDTLQAQLLETLKDFGVQLTQLQFNPSIQVHEKQ